MTKRSKREKEALDDIPFFLPSVTDGNLRLMKAVTGTLADASIPRSQVRSLCSDWGIGADKLYHMLTVMESVDLLRIVRKEHDRKAKTAGEKLFFSDPAFYAVLNGDKGNARETLAVMLCSYGGYTVEATKDETTGGLRSHQVYRIFLEFVQGRDRRSFKMSQEGRLRDP